MKDLIERLRNVKWAKGAQYGLISYPSDETHPVCAEAADALERLAAENQQAKEAIEALKDEVLK